VGVFPLHCTNLLSFVSFTFPPDATGTCGGGGGGSFDKGTLEILSITPDGAVIRLSGTSTSIFNVNIATDGVYNVPRCR